VPAPSSEHWYIAIDPVALSLGPLEIHWYGIMYLLAFLTFWALGVQVAQRRPWWGWSAAEVGDSLFYGMLGVVIGGRLGYVFFYGLDSLLEDPLFVFRIWDGGMSFHGGMLGVIVVLAWYARHTGRSFWQATDFAAPLVPIGLAFGRIGNFIGGELWGRLSDAPWAMVFANSIEHGGWRSEALREAASSGALDHLARHPSQLYQAGLEGLALFILLMWYSRIPRPAAAVSGLFLTGYGVFRTTAEFFREPDTHIGFVATDWLTMGMLLSIPMALIGVLMMIWVYRRQASPPAAAKP
jgi:phosphatidylglycerol:prolipoprotein diacylglycerol transferase